MVAETIGRDVAFGPENRAMPRPEIWARVDASLAETAPELDARSPIMATSGGQLQRVALAGALAYDADVLALDEPTSMLDAANAAQVRSAVADVAGAGRTVIVAEHRLDGWLDLADRMILLGEGGRVLADGPVQTVMADDAALAAAGIAPSSAVVGIAREPAAGTGDGATGDSDDSAGEPALVLEDVALRHPDGSGRVLHAGINLALRPGEAVAVTGPSGGGKSTLLRAVLGLDEIASGRIDRPGPSAVAFAPQNPEHSFVASTVADEAAASAWAERDRADALLVSTGLDGLRERNPFTLSGGEQQRLAIVAALASDPALLVLDEPTTGLDARRRDEVLALVDDAHRSGTAVLVATHDPDVVARCDRELRIEGPTSDTAAAPPPHRRAAAAHLNQLTMLGIGLAAMIGSFAVSSLLIGALALAPTLLLAPLAVRTLRSFAFRALPVLLGTATLAWSVMLLSPGPTFAPATISLAGKEALRIAAFVLPGVLLLDSVDATKLADALGQRLRLPARIVVGAGAGLAQLGTMRRRWRIIMEARRLRGLLRRRSVAPYASAALAMLVTSLRAATWQSIAMDARGFATAHRRTWAEPSPFTRADAAGALVGVVLLVWPWVAAALWG